MIIYIIKENFLMNFLKNTGLKNKKTYIKAYNYLQNGKFEESLRLFKYLLNVFY